MNNTSSQIPQMSAYFSDKLRVVSFFSILLVFYLHAGFPDEVIQTMTVPNVVRACIAGVFGPCAVPMFYAISGYLFFYGTDKGINVVFRKMRKRVWSLLIPFLIAAIVFPLTMCLMQLVPGAAAHINSEITFSTLADIQIPALLYQVFICGDGSSGMPWAYHLWFMQDLIFIVALSPLLYYVRRWLGWWSVVVVLCLHFLFPQVRFLMGLFWFMSGSFVLDKLERLSRRWAVTSLFAFLLLAIWHQFSPNTAIWEYIKIAKIAFGLIALWCVYGWLVPKSFSLANAPVLRFSCQYTFFLYLYHEPLFHVIVKGIPIVLGANWFGYTMSFLFSPLIFAPIGIAAGVCLKKFVPRLYQVLVGGR